MHKSKVSTRDYGASSTSAAVDSVPLYKRLQQREQEESELAHGNLPSNSKRNRKVEQPREQEDNDEGDNEADRRRKGKHAPTVMRSDRPVKRLRLNPNLKKEKFNDPRFSDLNGKLNYDKFMHSYQFLEEKQQSELQHLEKKMKKLKDADMKAQLKASYST